MIRVVKTIDTDLEKKVSTIGLYDTYDEAEAKVRKEAVEVDIPRMIGVRAGMPTDSEKDMILYFFKKAFHMSNGFAKVGNDDEVTYYAFVSSKGGDKN